jgi:hypothetical protein
LSGDDPGQAASLSYEKKASGAMGRIVAFSLDTGTDSL